MKASTSAMADTVLATVNAPYREKLSAQELADCLLDQALAEAKSGHVSSFFGEVAPALQVAFAHLFNITDAQLAAAAKDFEAYTGYPASSYALTA